MNIERMQQLVRVLERVSNNEQLKNSFNLGSWLGVNYDTERARTVNYYALSKQVEEADDPTMLVPECGTTACACGFAGLDPWFRSQGFKLEIDGGGPSIVYTLIGDNEELEDMYSWLAIRKFFDISAHLAYRLFEEQRNENEVYVTVDHVIARVKEYMELFQPGSTEIINK